MKTVCNLGGATRGCFVQPGTSQMNYQILPAVVLSLGLMATGLAINVLVVEENYDTYVQHNDYLSDADGQYYLVMHPDCNLVLYGQSGTPLSYSNSSIQSPFPLNCSLVLQGDGNLVIYNLTSETWDNRTSDEAIWAQGYSTPTRDPIFSYLLLGGGGTIGFYYANGTHRTVDYGGTIDSYGSFPPVSGNVSSFLPNSTGYKPWTPSASLLNGFPYMPAGYSLSAGNRLLSLSNTSELKLGTDCNLVSSKLASNGTPAQEVWSSGTSRPGRNSCQLTLQQNGNLQILSPGSGEVYWNSTDGAGDSSGSWILRVDPTTGNVSVSDIQNPANIYWTNGDARISALTTNPPHRLWPIAVGVAGGVFVLAMAALGLYFYSRQYFLDPADKAFQARLRANGGNSQAFSKAKIKRATNNYDNVLGHGGFGDVFYGKLPDGREVAAKVLSANSRQSKQEFYNEIELLSKVHHKYLVSLLGYSSTRTVQILIYEFMGGGNLRQRLQGVSSVENPLSWPQRTSIILQIAEGLEYLHHKCSPPIIHRDVKSSNILLTNNSVAKVADFGLSKLKTIGQEDATHVTTAVKGTPGYLDPEYHETGMLTEKSDVYAFGVVLLEILTGRHHMYIAQGVRDAWKLEQFDNMADANLKEVYDREELVRLVELALWCARTCGPERPSMDEVVRRLHEILLPPSERPLMIDSDEGDGHLNMSIELIPLTSTNFSSESMHVIECSSTGTSFEVSSLR